MDKALDVIDHLVTSVEIALSGSAISVPETVDITLIGNKSSIYLATQLGEHEVVLDLSKYSAGTYKVKLKYSYKYCYIHNFNILILQIFILLKGVFL